MLNPVRAAICCFALLLLFTTFSLAEDFPFRSKYPEIAVVSPADLKTGYDRNDFLIVDLRSKTEFDTIHIKDAVHIPYADALFLERLAELAQKNPGRKIALYDNGITCNTTYIAAEDALYEMIPNVFAFDSGILTWARKYPSATLLLGKDLRHPDKELISEQRFNKKKIDFGTFQDMAASPDSVILDIRDPLQRKAGKLPGIDRELQVPLDKIVKNIISKGHLKDKKLCIYDHVGRQVLWLMYYLEENNYPDYYFLDGGATSVLRDQKDQRLSLRR